jgi:segregation and condensation protein B
MELKYVLEALLFSSQEPLSPKALRDLLSETAGQVEEARPFKKVKVEQIDAALEELTADHARAGRSFRLACVAGSWQFCTEPEYGPWIKTLVGERHRPTRLSQPALETLAIVAYRQPMTRAEIEQIRGVTVDGVMQTLLERGLVEPTGRADVVGRPMTYGTTAAFLEYFGLRGLEDLPAADELRRVPVEKPETLLTVDPGLATAPPDQLQMVELKDGETDSGPPPPPPAAPETPAEPAPATKPDGEKNPPPTDS